MGVVAGKSEWGPWGWYLFHLLAYYYQPKFHHLYQVLFENMVGQIIPCPLCQSHYRAFVEGHSFPGITDHPHRVRLWVTSCHNNVNRLLQKKEWTQQMVDKLYLKNDKWLPDIDHTKIIKFLRVVQSFHRLYKSLPLYREFMRVLSQIYPDIICRRLLLAPRKSKVIPYLKIIQNHSRGPKKPMVTPSKGVKNAVVGKKGSGKGKGKGVVGKGKGKGVVGKGKGKK